MTSQLSNTIASLNFLVAEDHEFQRNALTWMLAGLGATQIHEASDGREALNIMCDPERPVDIVISDLDMPGMDGMEFIRHLGKSGTRASIILASALGGGLLASIVPMAEAFGITLLGVIEKPITPEKLMRLIVLHRPHPEASGAVARQKIPLDDLRAGLQNDEFEPFYQPKIELQTGRLCGAEALARWRHPRQGLVPAYSFIDTLEKSGFIDELTWIILRKALTGCAGWGQSGIHADVSVNLSIKSVEGPKFAERLSALATSCDVSPQRVVLELTESAATIDVGGALENLARMRMMGFGLSIDDYGKGYSSMHQLSRIAFTELKIDRAFVTGAARKESSRVILESSLGLSNRLGLVSVGEGVETQEDLRLLCELGCDMAQGYHIARPMDYNAWVSWARAWNPKASKCHCEPA